MSNESPKPPELKVVRGFVLGLPIFLVLLVSAVIVYIIAGAIGWKGNTQILVAMCAGPFVGFALVGLFFYIVRPKVV